MINLYQTAVKCVAEMGDVFWDYHPGRDAHLDFRDPTKIAIETVEKTLRKAIYDALGAESATISLNSKYKTLIAELPDESNDEQVIGTLVANADWTPRCAREILLLARRYGTSVLRNALALAGALRIEDGDAGL